MCFEYSAVWGCLNGKHGTMFRLPELRVLAAGPTILEGVKKSKGQPVRSRGLGGADFQKYPKGPMTFLCTSARSKGSPYGHWHHPCYRPKLHFCCSYEFRTACWLVLFHLCVLLTCCGTE